MTLEEQFLKWAEDKKADYISGFLDGLSQAFLVLSELYKNSAQKNTE